MHLLRHHTKPTEPTQQPVDVADLKLDDGQINSRHLPDLQPDSASQPGTSIASSSVPSTVSSTAASTSELAADDSSEDEFVEAPESATAVSTPVLTQQSSSTAEPIKRATRPIKLNRALTHDEVYLSPEQLQADLVEVKAAFQLFLNSRMIEAEQICVSS